MTMGLIHSIYLLILSIIVQVQASDSNCLSFDVLLTQNIENSGFHRELKWLLEITKPSNEIILGNKCSFIVQLEMPQGAFLNPDQLSDLQRMGVLNASIDGFVDVELFDHEATNHTVNVFIETGDYTKVPINLPFHLRYQRAQVGGGFGKVILSRPSVLARCSQKLRKLCSRKVAFAPCQQNSLSNCRWMNITYEALFDVDEVLVPVGDLDHYPIVSIISLLIGCFGCFYVLSLLSMFSKKPFIVQKIK